MGSFNLLTHVFQSIICKCYFHEYFMSFETWTPISCTTPRNCLWISIFLLFTTPSQSNQIQGRQASGKYFVCFVYKNFHVLFKAPSKLFPMLLICLVKDSLSSNRVTEIIKSIALVMPYNRKQSTNIFNSFFFFLFIIYLFTYLFMYLFVYLFICLFIYWLIDWLID